MRAHDTSKLLLLLGLLAMAAAPVASYAEQPAMAPADDEQETDDLPPWARIDLEGDPAPEAQVRMLEDYGADIPDPEDVMAGRRARPAASERETAPPPAAAPAVEFDDFHSELSPHGRWVSTPEYGMVFVPTRQTQVAGWRPYLYGQWAWTSYGWTWVSDEPFGWATYHYGRWAHRPALGWVWVPGYTWGPAWVAWRHGEGAVGWAPLYPGYVSWTTSYPYHVDHWVFVGPTWFYGHPIHRHWYRDRTAYYYGRSSWTRNWRAGGRGHVYTGPPVRRIESSSRGRVMESRVIAVGSPRRGEVLTGRSGQSAGDVRIYRPTNRGAVRGRDAAVGNRSGGGSVRPTDRRTVKPGSREPDRRVAPAPSGGRPDRGSTPSQPGPRAPDRRVSPAQPAPRSGTPSKPVPRPGDDRRKAPGPRSPGQVQPGSSPARIQPAPAPRQASPRSSLAPSSSPRPGPSATAPKGSSSLTSGSSTPASSPRSGSPSYSAPRPSTSSSRSSSSSSSSLRSSSSASPRSLGSAGSLRPAPTVRTQQGSSRPDVSRPNLHR